MGSHWTRSRGSWRLIFSDGDEHLPGRRRVVAFLLSPARLRLPMPPLTCSWTNQIITALCDRSGQWLSQPRGWEAAVDGGGVRRSGPVRACWWRGARQLTNNTSTLLCRRAANRHYLGNTSTPPLRCHTSIVIRASAAPSRHHRNRRWSRIPYRTLTVSSKHRLWVFIHRSSSIRDWTLNIQYKSPSHITVENNYCANLTENCCTHWITSTGYHTDGERNVSPHIDDFHIIWYSSLWVCNVCMVTHGNRLNKAIMIIMMTMKG